MGVNVNQLSRATIRPAYDSVKEIMKILEVTYIIDRTKRKDELEVIQDLFGLVEENEEKYFNGAETPDVVDQLLEKQGFDCRDDDLGFILFPSDYIKPNGEYNENVGDYFADLIENNDLAIITNVIFPNYDEYKK